MTSAKATETLHLNAGDTEWLRFSTSKAINSTSWYSNAPSIVSVDTQYTTSAMIRAVKSSPLKIIVRCDYNYFIDFGGYTYLARGFEDFYVYVNAISPTSISLPGTVALYAGSYTTLTPTLTPSNAEADMTWSSSDSSVATVNSSGRVHAVATGTVDITVKTSNEKTSTCQVIVTNPPIVSTWADIIAALDLSNATGSNSSDAPWFSENTTTHDGIDAVESGAISDNQSSVLTLQATGPCTLSFWWRVSSEYGWDYLRFSVDGVEQSKISGNVAWEQKDFTLPDGEHALAWSYTKDESGAYGSDAGWLDCITIQSTTDIPVGLNDSIPLGDSWYESSWYGCFYTDPTIFGDWIWHLSHGWQYIFSASDTDIYIFENATGDWWYVNATWYPYLYNYSTSSWLFYYDGVTPERRFWDDSTGSLIGRPSL
jgi:hypothetical protein